MTSQALFDRIDGLTASLKQTGSLIQQLATLQPLSVLPESSRSTTAAEMISMEDMRLDIGGEIVDALNSHEMDLEMLKLDVEDLPVPITANRRSSLNARATERMQDLSRLNAGCTRLAEDLKTARIRFRHAQLRAKRSSDLARRKESEDYLSSLRTAAAAMQKSSTKSTTSDGGDGASSPSQSQAAPSLAQLQSSLFRRTHKQRDPSTTEADMLLGATSDVTASLKRTHNLLTDELSRSRYAHETLNESNAALKELNERYGGLDDLLSRSRSLLGSLMRSQKSDTWFLQTTVYLLAATLAWLVFRRFLYGPMWWFVWQPLRLVYSVAAFVLGPVAGLAGRSPELSGTRTPLRVMPSATGRPPPIPEGMRGRAGGVYMPAGAGGAGAKRGSDESNQEGTGDGEKQGGASQSLSSIIGTMLDEAQAAGFTQAPYHTVVEADAPMGSQPPSSSLTDREREQAAAAAAAAARGDEEQRQQQQNRRQGASGDEARRPGDADGGGVRRADGRVLPDRDERTQPRNPKKRMMEVPEEEQQRQQQQQQQQQRDEL